MDDVRRIPPAYRDRAQRVTGEEGEEPGREPIRSLPGAASRPPGGPRSGTAARGREPCWRGCGRGGEGARLETRPRPVLDGAPGPAPRAGAGPRSPGLPLGLGLVSRGVDSVQARRRAHELAAFVHAYDELRDGGPARDWPWDQALALERSWPRLQAWIREIDPGATEVRLHEEVQLGGFVEGERLDVLRHAVARPAEVGPLASDLIAGRRARSGPGPPDRGPRRDGSRPSSSSRASSSVRVTRARSTPE